MSLTIRSAQTIRGGLTLKGNSPPSPSLTFFPLSNTATDPTDGTWQTNNPGYTFVPYVGITTLTPMTDASFMFLNNATFNDPDVALWDTSTITNMSQMFSGAIVFNQSLNSWNTSAVISMESMFSGATTFNGNISSWNTSNVLYMNYMFSGATAFDQPIGAWNTASVTSMGIMFSQATAFNQNIGSWNTSNVNNMYSMFDGATAFNCGQASGVAHDLMQRTAATGWRVGKVTAMAYMFNNAAAFNGDISSWCETLIATVPEGFATGANVNWTTGRQPTWSACPYPNLIPSPTFFPLSNTATDPTSADWQTNNPGYTFTPNVGITTPTPMTDASYMFYQNSTFNDPDVSIWNTSSITNMPGMFIGTAFDQPLTSWDVSNVTDISGMFNSTTFNQPLNSWNTGKVITMAVLFYQNYSFNQDISGWDVSKVTNMGNMFDQATSFNQDIGSWNISSVLYTDFMFNGATAFNCGQSSGVAHDLMQRTAISGWQIGNVTSMPGMFANATAFNGDISNWCVTLISTAPANFATGANANFTVGRQPTWGACPYPN